MRSGGAIGAIPAFLKRHPRPARAAGWGLAGAAAGMAGWWASDWLVSHGMYADWSFGPVDELTPAMLFFGFACSATLGILLWRGGHAGGVRAAGFALLATGWLPFGWNVTAQAFELLPGTSYATGQFRAVAAGFMAASLWLSLAALLCLPAPLGRRAAAFLAASGAAFAVVAGTAAQADFPEFVERLQYAIAAWCAVQAAALALAVPEPRGGGEIRNGGT